MLTHTQVEQSQQDRKAEPWDSVQQGSERALEREERLSRQNRYVLDMLLQVLELWLHLYSYK